ncbi:UvrD/REP helicase family protein (macronuclear) [Tetrahymena thermophila SB210]|uniref:DNA 3'-5' helicase n=1 Tax=Tetrahymena thermophila (strain SB210) TaxID=312017 RepID=Q23U94_TETTS|nr:UvrD/REP helicase family protein [Tetrahymena thermophila SB210]EAS00050.2 UvrD/REP helicase family protein [Tetrahymena thermophila SB210]|eukprot:XP_001020295.2 UvrD/REP helicase family protein [Tetrahymena thermophila SB210]
MEDKNIKNKSFEYTQQQKEFIYASKRRDIKVTACAGSGKTQCVLMYVKEAIDEGFDPSAICITTFNIQASNDMKKRAVQLIGKDKADKIEITNIDKLITKLFNSIQRAKKQKDNEKQKNEIEKELLIDITLVEKQSQVYEDLQDLSLSKEIFEKYKIIIFDEFQDINQLQYDIFMLFKKIGESILVVVGDDAQNIYEFRGSNYEFLRSKVIEDVNRENKRIYGSEDYTMLDIKLTTNFRCSSKITKFANDIIKSFNIIQQNTMQSYEDLEGYKNEKSQVKPTLESYKSYNDQFNSILTQIQTFINQGYSYEDIAIICPKGSLLRDIEYKLEKHNSFKSDQIPFWSFIGKNNDFDFKYEYKGNKVTLLTIHKSKGLEWKVLFFVGLNDDQFPKAFLKQKNNQDRQIEEMTRLFYVGSTRAAKILNMSYFSYPQRCACRFLSKINENYMEFKGDIAIFDGKQCNPILSSILKSQDSNYNNVNNSGKQISEIFEEMSNAQHLKELEFSQKKYLQEKYFELEEVYKVHEQMFTKQQIQNFFFHQSVELLFTYLETITLWIMQHEVKIESRSLILNEQKIQIDQLSANSKKLQISELQIQSFKNAFIQFLKIDKKTNQSEELIEAFFKVSLLYEISKSKNQIYKYLYKKNIFSSLTKTPIIECLDLFVKYVKTQESEEILILDKIQDKSDFDPDRTFDYFTISGKETLYEISQSFKKTKKIQKQVMLTVLAKISILKKKYGKDIKKVKFYNPIKGTVFSVLIKDWQLHSDFIDFMEKFNEKLKNPQQTN